MRWREVAMRGGRLASKIPVSFQIHSAARCHQAAAAQFEKFPPSHRREYIEWITEAKTEATRQRRLDQAVEWMSEGKPRNWKYVRKS